MYNHSRWDWIKDKRHAGYRTTLYKLLKWIQYLAIHMNVSLTTFSEKFHRRTESVSHIIVIAGPGARLLLLQPSATFNAWSSFQPHSLFATNTCSWIERWSWSNVVLVHLRMATVILVARNFRWAMKKRVLPMADLPGPILKNLAILPQALWRTWSARPYPRYLDGCCRSPTDASSFLGLVHSITTIVYLESPLGWRLREAPWNCREQSHCEH